MAKYTACRTDLSRRSLGEGGNFEFINVEFAFISPGPDTVESL